MRLVINGKRNDTHEARHTETRARPLHRRPPDRHARRNSAIHIGRLPRSHSGVTLEEFQLSVKGSAAAPPPQSSPALKALWLEGRGEWEKAHEAAQSDHTSEGSWVHAYLHRKDGDLGNAAYWYSRAGRPVADGSSEEEWTSIVRALLG